MTSSGKKIKFNDNGKITEGEVITSPVIWLRSVVDSQCVNSYFFSTDGENFKALGDPYKLRWGGFRGDNIGIFNYNDLEEVGYVDIDWFRYQLL